MCLDQNTTPLSAENGIGAVDEAVGGGAVGAEIVGEWKPVLDALENGDFDPIGQVLAQGEFDALPQQAVVPCDGGFGPAQGGH